MKEPAVVTLPGIGAVTIRKSARARRMSISVTAKGEVRATIPLRGSVRQAQAFLREKTGWIARHRQAACTAQSRGEALASQCREITRQEAKILLTERLERLARLYGFTYGRLSLRNQKTRWGSCSAKNNISLNEKLARLPERLIDYVILHELVHTRLKHHGREFWQELEHYLPDARACRRDLRQYRLDTLGKCVPG